MNIKAAVIQAAPILLDLEATVKKACKLIIEASEQGANLILMPEAFIPFYPRGLTFGAPIGSRSEKGRSLWMQYWQNSIDVPGPETEKLEKAIKKANSYVAIGVTEREGNIGRGTLYCTLLYFDPNGKLIGKHRKLKPTGQERVIWGEGDGSTLTVLDTKIGKWGGLICWENYMPLARMSMYGKGIELYMAPTADARDTWQATLQHIACEGRCFVLGCNQFVTKDMYPDNLEGIEDLETQPEVLCRGGSAIITPLGEYLAGPLWDKEGVLYADLDMSLVPKGRFDFDVVGHYAKPDVFKLIVNENPQRSVDKQIIQTSYTFPLTLHIQ